MNKFSKFAKFFVYIFIIYMLWYKYVYGEKTIILNGSAIMAALCMIIDIIANNKDFTKICPLVVAMNLIMCVYSVLTGVLFGARDIDLLIRAVKTYSAFSVVCIVVSYISREENSLEWLFNIFIFVCIVDAIYILTRGYFKVGYGYILSATDNPNTIGITMTLGTFGIAYRLRKERRFKYVEIGLAMLFVYIIIGCGSRKSLLAVLIVCAIFIFEKYVYLWKHHGKGAQTIIMFSIGLIVFAVYYFYFHVYTKTYSYNRMQTLGGDEYSSSARLLFYERAFDYFLERPLFGIGLQQFRRWNPDQAYAHSTYAESLADWGLVGCILYYYPVIWSIRRMLKNWSQSKDTYSLKLFISLWIIELFLGFGQIWFYDFNLLLSWTIISIYVDLFVESPQKIVRNYKYIVN